MSKWKGKVPPECPKLNPCPSHDTDNNQQQLQYDYIPTEWICITFLALFGVSTFVHTVQAIHSRFWWLFPSAIFCGILELVGWSGRLWSSQNPFLETPYIIQGVNLVIAPTPLVAANFILLGLIIRRLGPQYSRLTPRRYQSDIISLVVQAIGAAIASGSTSSGSQTQANLVRVALLFFPIFRWTQTPYASLQGANIALGGTIFQLISITVYCALATEFLVRYTRDRPVRRSAPMPGEVLRGTINKRLNRMLQAMITMTIFIFIRTIYRVIEFAGGWNGKVIATQWVFIIIGDYADVFDGTMIVLAMYTLNLFHPGIYLREDDYPPQTSSEGTVMEDRQIPTDHQDKAV
ncbi:RTA1-like protein [Russula emetica]|nr:RTA1-like protein [Russula emetica]